MNDTFRKSYNSLHLKHGFELEVKKQAEILEGYFKKISSREMSLAMINLEQSIMWATKAIYSKEDKEN
jgi:hypothetical protein